MFDEVKRYVETHDMFAKGLGITVEAADIDFARVSMPLSDQLMNSLGRLHGGAVFTLADMAFGVAANFGKSQNGMMVTTNGAVSFMKAAKNGPISAEARLIGGGKRMATYEIRIYDGDESLIGACQLTGYRLDTPLFVE